MSRVNRPPLALSRLVSLTSTDVFDFYDCYIWAFAPGATAAHLWLLCVQMTATVSFCFVSLKLRKMKAKGDFAGKICVVVGTITDDLRLYEVPAIKVGWCNDYYKKNKHASFRKLPLKLRTVISVWLYEVSFWRNRITSSLSGNKNKFLVLSPLKVTSQICLWSPIIIY